MDTETIKKEVDALLQSPFTLSQKEMCARMLSFIDLTTLDGTDTQERVSNLCKKAIEYKTAAVCVYPYYASLVKQNLAGSGIRTACVAGGFPASQLTLEMKLFEIEKTLANGADEIDMVISQGAFLEGDYKRVGDEVKAIKELCGEAHLKVILETGNLQTPDNIEKASCIAIDNGADFIKTSTGKTSVSATLEAFYVMLRVIERYAGQGRIIGIKPAGGISSVESAVPYFKLVKLILGDRWLTPELFRIGASRLADALYEGAR
ncbi:MAG: deoxyribose-phosphate aldolase [Bacteroidales bacterium]|nr:deoxyribose-phosphate aldolase [Bacteroidales bacterium]